MREPEFVSSLRRRSRS